MPPLISLGWSWVIPRSDAPPSVPGTVDDVTVSECSVHTLPGSWSFTWMGDSDTDRRHAADAIGVSDLPVVLAFAEGGFAAGQIGYPAVLMTREIARQVRVFAHPDSPLRLLELALPASFVPEATDECAPLPGRGETALYRALCQRRAVGAGVLLGFDLLIIDTGLFRCSYRCHDLAPMLASHCSARFNRWGLLPDLTVASACARALTEGVLPTAPRYWLPVAMIDATPGCR